MNKQERFIYAELAKLNWRVAQHFAIWCARRITSRLLRDQNTLAALDVLAAQADGNADSMDVVEAWRPADRSWRLVGGWEQVVRDAAQYATRHISSLSVFQVADAAVAAVKAAAEFAAAERYESSVLYRYRYCYDNEDDYIKEKHAVWRSSYQWRVSARASARREELAAQAAMLRKISKVASEDEVVAMLRA